MKSKPTCFRVTLLLMFMKSIVTVGGRHFDPLFDIPIELPSKNRMTENYLDQLETRKSNIDIIQLKKDILKNENLVEDIKAEDETTERYPVIKCLQRCKSSHQKCCRIFYRNKPQVRNDLEDRESLASSPITNSVGMIGTFLGVAFAGYKLTRGFTKTARDNQMVFNPEHKIFISGADEDLDWIDKLKDFIQSEENVFDIESFLCCIHVGPSPGLECYPKPRHFAKKGNKLEMDNFTCESGLSYNIDVVL